MHISIMKLTVSGGTSYGEGDGGDSGCGFGGVGGAVFAGLYHFPLLKPSQQL